jgi:hypothetical protein
MLLNFNRVWQGLLDSNQRLVPCHPVFHPWAIIVGDSPFEAMDEAHNELCIARALRLNTTPQFSSLAYEPG